MNVASFPGLELYDEGSLDVWYRCLMRVDLIFDTGICTWKRALVRVCAFLYCDQMPDTYNIYIIARLIV